MDGAKNYFGKIFKRKQSSNDGGSTSNAGPRCGCFGNIFNRHDHNNDQAGQEMEELGSPEIFVSYEESQREAIPYSYKDLERITDDFDASRVLGEGGFGKVYRAEVQIEGKTQAVAIKQLVPRRGQGAGEYMTEVMTLQRARHPNVVRLIGFCSEKQHRLLVYEFVPLQTLDEHLHECVFPTRLPLDWITRMSIALGTIKGLWYIHYKMYIPMIYRDLKAANILIDEGYVPKLSDFGLAKAAPQDGSTSVYTPDIMGTPGYVAPEYTRTGLLAYSSDIYSYGVLLLEIITGRKPVDQKRGAEQELIPWARPLMADSKNFTSIVDPNIVGQFEESHLREAIDIVRMCIRVLPESRPTSAVVVTSMEDLFVKISGTQVQRYEPKGKGIAPITPGTSSDKSKDKGKGPAVITPGTSSDKSKDKGEGPSEITPGTSSHKTKDKGEGSAAINPETSSHKTKDLGVADRKPVDRKKGRESFP